MLAGEAGVRQTSLVEHWGDIDIDFVERSGRIKAVGYGLSPRSAVVDPVAQRPKVKRTRKPKASGLWRRDLDVGDGLGVTADGRVLQPTNRQVTKAGHSLSGLARSQKPFRALGSELNQLRGGRPSSKNLADAWNRRERAQTEEGAKGRAGGPHSSTRRTRRLMSMKPGDSYYRCGGGRLPPVKISRRPQSQQELGPGPVEGAAAVANRTRTADSVLQGRQGRPGRVHSQLVADDIGASDAAPRHVGSLPPIHAACT